MASRIPDSIIRSIQQGVATIASAATTATATITAVDTLRAFVIDLGFDTNAAAATDSFCHVDLTNSTTVTITRTGTANVTINVEFMVVELF